MGFAQINPRTLSSIQRCCRRHHHYHKYAANVLFNCFKMQSWRIYSKMPQFVLCRNLSQECFNFPWRQNAVGKTRNFLPIYHPTPTQSSPNPAPSSSPLVQPPLSPGAFSSTPFNPAPFNPAQFNPALYT